MLQRAMHFEAAEHHALAAPSWPIAPHGKRPS